MANKANITSSSSRHGRSRHNRGLRPSNPEERVGRKRQGFGLGMNPEFRARAEAVKDFQKQTGLSLAQSDARSHEAMARLYADFGGATPIFTTRERRDD